MRHLLSILFTVSVLAQDVPRLLDAHLAKSNVTLTWTHPTAYDFTIRVVQDGQSLTNRTHHEGNRLGQIHSFSQHYRVLGRTNVFSVAVAGSTNWSNEITVIP